MPGALAVRVVPATTVPLGRRVSRWPLAVVMIAGNGGMGGEMGMVLELELMCSAEESRETMGLSIAKPVSPGARVVPAGTMWDEERVMVWLPTVKWDNGVGGAVERMLWNVNMPSRRSLLVWKVMCALDIVVGDAPAVMG